MPTPNPFPLEIIEKVNSPELLAFLQQFGHDKYADAEDINAIVQALKYLYENSTPADIENKVDKIEGYSLTKNDLSNALKATYDAAVSKATSAYNWIFLNGSFLLGHLENTSNPHSVTAAQVGAPSGSGTSSGTNTGDQDLSPYANYAIARTGSTITFDTPAIYNSPSSPSTSNLSDDLTGARIGIIQPIYINKAVEPSYPAGWVKIGTGTFTPSVLNMICCEWVGGTRVNYWITKA